MAPTQLAPTSRRSTTPSRHEAILDAAVAMATAGGYEAVRMRVVAEQTGIAVGTLYRYFPSKPHLLVAALTREFVVADGTVDFMRAEAIIARMMARAIAGGDPTSHQIQIAAGRRRRLAGQSHRLDPAPHHHRRGRPTAPPHDPTPRFRRTRRPDSLTILIVLVRYL